MKSFFKYFFIKKYHLLFFAFIFFYSCEVQNDSMDEIKPIEELETINNNSPVENNTNTSESKNISYLALGDSYTIGTSVNREDSFPFILVEELESLNVYSKEPRVIAQTGWTTSSLLNAINQENITEEFELVTLLIGVNNQYSGQSISTFREEFEQLLNLALKFAGNNTDNVVVISIPDWSASPYATGRDKNKIRQEIDAFNNAKQIITASKNITFINITEITRQAEGNDYYFASDQLHFSGAMHKLWVDEILKYINF